MNNSDMPANSTSFEVSSRYEEGYYDQVALGLTKREHFAGLAMQHILMQYNPFEQGDFDSSDYSVVVKNAVGLADALLEELDK